MKFAVIAAGEGSRLQEEGLTTPKPLIKVGKEILVDRLIRIFIQNDASEIVVICNDRTDKVYNHLRQLQKEGLYGVMVPLRIKVKSTPSSMHSFFEISSCLEQEPFILTTVDTIFDSREFSEFVDSFEKSPASGVDGLLGLTTFVDDERPLWVQTDDEMNIKSFMDEDPNHLCSWVSGGVYGFRPSVIRTLRTCVNRGDSRLRSFQRALVSEGYRLKAYPFGKVFDIDHVSDIPKAEAYLSSNSISGKKK